MTKGKSIAAVAKQNTKYADQIKKMLWLGTRDVVENSASRVLEELVVATWHDSSNAAFNWQFQFNGEAVPYIDFKGIDPVGSERDQRSESGDVGAIERAAITKMSTEKQRLHNYLFRTKFTPDMPRFNNFNVANPVEDDEYWYAVAARIEQAAQNGMVRKAFDTEVTMIASLVFSRLRG